MKRVAVLLLMFEAELREVCWLKLGNRRPKLLAELYVRFTEEILQFLVKRVVVGYLLFLFLGFFLFQHRKVERFAKCRIFVFIALLLLARAARFRVCLIVSGCDQANRGLGRPRRMHSGLCVLTERGYRAWLQY